MKLVHAEASVDVAAALAEFARVGYARLGPALSLEGQTLLGQRLEDLMMARLELPGLFFQKDAARYEELTFGQGFQGPSLEYRKVEKLERDELFRAWIENPLFEQIARAHVGGDVALYRAVVFTKAATGGSALPWHQDGGDFWGVDRPPSLQIWTALDDAPEESGCVEVVPGSHLRGLATPKGGTIPEALVAADLAAGRVVKLPAKAGESMLIHNWLWHRSGANTTGLRRSALSICYMSAETKCLRKRRAPRQFVRLFEGK
ncbi:MAG TPA: phytanoyl-CoA dioxygenase family protein [Myxococcales bacterium]|nr:phytanoyl-CoA dioxygenase family protein [Myxococcales bacterium]